jgi:hypothetical protein
MAHRVTHRVYYASVAQAAGLVFPTDHPLVERAARSKDPHFNDIPLQLWDDYALSMRSDLARALRAHEDGFSVAGGVCIVKEAVKQAVKRLKDPWQEWRRQALALELAELARHASVSTSNRHSCRDCFCCACVEVQSERLALRAAERSQAAHARLPMGGKVAPR